MLANGAPCGRRDLVGPGAVLDVTPGADPVTHAEPDASVRFDVVHEDEELLVVNKPAGIPVHPARGHRTGTLVNGLLARPGFERVTADPRDPDGQRRPGIVHRIDKGTSGLLVVAKTERAREALKSQLAAHSVHRRYFAIVRGVPAEGRIESLMGRHPSSRVRFSSRVTRGRRAVTHVGVSRVHLGGAASSIECRLETGRTHQIRVHLFECRRTPLLGDPLYGAPPEDPVIRAASDALGRQALHAVELGFIHPATGASLSFRAELPDDLRAALAALGG